MKIARQQLRLLIESIVSASSLLSQYEDASNSEYPNIFVPGVLLNALDELKNKKDEYTAKINEIEKARELDDKYQRTRLPPSEIEAMERFADQALDNYYEIYKIVQEINSDPILQKELFNSGDYARYGTFLKTPGSREAYDQFNKLHNELTKFVEEEFEP